MSNYLPPPELAKAVVEMGRKKAHIPGSRMFLLGILAGAYIGFAAHLATTVATGPWECYGAGKFMVGAVFSVGLMLVVIPGSELWTGNNLMAPALLQRKITFSQLMKNWTIVYLGNLVGSILLAWMIASESGLLSGPVGGTAINIAYAKVSETPGGLGHNYAFFWRAIGCNWLVCLAVLMALASKDIQGKILGIFFPIMAFVACGFEHCVANMYFIPAGIFAKRFDDAIDASGKTPDQLSALDWSNMWTDNLLVVTLGNFIGGALLVGVVYWWIYLRSEHEA
jgi:formate transporter